jgi:hypothetical protein
LSAGATLVQAYTGLIYEGPRFAKKGLNQLAAMQRSTVLPQQSAPTKTHLSQKMSLEAQNSPDSE